MRRHRHVGIRHHQHGVPRQPLQVHQLGDLAVRPVQPRVADQPGGHAGRRRHRRLGHRRRPGRPGRARANSTSKGAACDLAPGWRPASPASPGSVPCSGFRMLAASAGPAGRRRAGQPARPRAPPAAPSPPRPAPPAPASRPSPATGLNHETAAASCVARRCALRASKRGSQFRSRPRMKPSPAALLCLALAAPALGACRGTRRSRRQVAQAGTMPPVIVTGRPRPTRPIPSKPPIAASSTSTSSWTTRCSSRSPRGYRAVLGPWPRHAHPQRAATTSTNPRSPPTACCRAGRSRPRTSVMRFVINSTLGPRRDVRPGIDRRAAEAGGRSRPDPGALGGAGRALPDAAHRSARPTRANSPGMIGNGFLNPLGYPSPFLANLGRGAGAGAGRAGAEHRERSRNCGPARSMSMPGCAASGGSTAMPSWAAPR